LEKFAQRKVSCTPRISDHLHLLYQEPPGVYVALNSAGLGGCGKRQEERLSLKCCGWLSFGKQSIRNGKFPYTNRYFINSSVIGSNSERTKANKESIHPANYLSTRQHLRTATETHPRKTHNCLSVENCSWNCTFEK
jgi:hypothetical protein